MWDLSATPFHLAGSGWAEGSLFPWVASDFALMDAIESGIVNLPREPVADDRPTEVRTAFDALHGHYGATFRLWEEHRVGVPPVFIVVCNTTTNSELVRDYIAGHEVEAADGTDVVQGKLSLLRNFSDGLDRLGQPRTIPIDSAAIEAGDLAMPAQDFEDHTSNSLDPEQLRHRDGPGDEAGPLDDIDFDLLRRDEINVAYILALIATLRAAEGDGSVASQRKVRATPPRIMERKGVWVFDDGVGDLDAA